MLPTDPDTLARLLYLVLLCLGLTTFYFIGGRRISRALRDLFVWGLIFAMLMIAYVYRDDLRRQFTPGSAMRVEGETIELTRSLDGHFHANLGVNGASVRFIVDTGATDIVLSRSDAQAIGLDPDALNYSGRAYTANGMVATAPIRLAEVTFGPFTDTNLRASVNSGQIDLSLLGMSYLDRYSRIEIAGNRMLLHR